MDSGGALAVRLIIMLILGICTALIAKAKGRSVIGWFFGGFFLGIIGLIIVACLANLKEQKRKEETLRMQNLRMQERLRQEQLKNEAFRQHAATRLDAHDSALQIDTKQTPVSNQLEASPQSNSNMDQLLNQTQTANKPPITSGAMWHYVNGVQSVGPVSKEKMLELFTTGQLDSQSMVWQAGFDSWVKAHMVPEFALAAKI